MAVVISDDRAGTFADVAAQLGGAVGVVKRAVLVHADARRLLSARAAPAAPAVTGPVAVDARVHVEPVVTADAAARPLGSILLQTDPVARSSARQQND